MSFTLSMQKSLCNATSDTAHGSLAEVMDVIPTRHVRPVYLAMSNSYS